MKDDKPYLMHIKDAVEKIEKFTKGFDYNKFSKNDLVQSAVIRQIEIIGEATNRLSTDLKNEYTEISWKDVIGMRHKLIHDYFGVDLKRVWRTIEKDIPRLKNVIEKILKKQVDQDAIRH